MIIHRKSEDRGFADHGWLKSFHSFSFADYYDPLFMGFGDLRVLNQDQVAGGCGFPMHGHQNMEIISIVLEGTLEHKDSMGNSTEIIPGEVQRMSAGTGIHHSEYNQSKTELVHFFQIWILPKSRDANPSYEQKSFKESIDSGKLTLVASYKGRDGSISLNQDVDIFILKSVSDQIVKIDMDLNRKIWIQSISGAATINGIIINTGDGIGLGEVKNVIVDSKVNTELVILNLSH